MNGRGASLWRVVLLIALQMAVGPQVGSSHQETPAASLREIGPAPAFSLTTQDNTPLSLKQLRGKVVGPRSPDRPLALHPPPAT